MAVPNKDALLVAVRSAVETEVRRRDIRQANGGNITLWPYVSQVMALLTGRQMEPEKWRREFRTLRDRYQDASKLADLGRTVPETTYSEAFQSVFSIARLLPLPVKASTKPETKEASDDDIEENPTFEPDLKFALRLKRTEQRARFYEKAYNELLDYQAHNEGILETIGRAVEALPLVDVAAIPGPTIVLNNRPRKLIPLLSDMHGGETVNANRIKGFNEYNYSVLDERLERWCTQVEEQFQYQRAAGPVEAIHLPMLGDVVTGENIYKGQHMHIEETAMHQIFSVSDRLATALLRLARLGAPLLVDGVGGNHARMGRKGESDFSNDFLTYKFLESRLANQPNITFRFDYAFWTTAKHWDWRFYFCHGDNIRGWGGFPWYGLARADANTQMMMLTQGQWYHYFCLGHFHTDVSWQTPIGKRFGNGNWIGTTEYTINGGFGGRPSQKLLVVTESGGVEQEIPLYLDVITPDFMNQTAAGHGPGWAPQGRWK